MFLSVYWMLHTAEGFIDSAAFSMPSIQVLMIGRTFCSMLALDCITCLILFIRRSSISCRLCRKQSQHFIATLEPVDFLTYLLNEDKSNAEKSLNIAGNQDPVGSPLPPFFSSSSMGVIMTGFRYKPYPSWIGLSRSLQTEYTQISQLQYKLSDQRLLLRIT